MPIKKGLLIPNGLGIIDQDYSGDEDELKLESFNFTKKAVKVEKGERIAQGVLVKIAIGKFTEVKQKPRTRGQTRADRKNMRRLVNACRYPSSYSPLGYLMFKVVPVETT